MKNQNQKKLFLNKTTLVNLGTVLDAGEQRQIFGGVDITLPIPGTTLIRVFC